MVGRTTDRPIPGKGRRLPWTRRGWAAGAPTTCRSQRRDSSAREYNSIHMVAELLESIASVEVQMKEYRRAARIFGAAAAIRDAVGMAVHPEDREEVEADLAAVAEALEADEFREALDEGRGMSIEDAVSDAVAARETGRPGVSGA
ncbi:MAG: hypothetical protein IPF82_04490 [Blastocatellia bacterium]|nr:hypothetical protein [Blastocatellia bacterium]